MAATLRPTKRQANGESSSTAPPPPVSTANGSVLPEELLYEILLLLPAKPLCRLRAVCRSWRFLLSDSLFVAAHKARHGPLVAAFNKQTMGLHILNTSGHTVRQIRLQDQDYPRNRFAYADVPCANLDLFCFVGADKRPRVIDPATGVVSLLPDDSEFHHMSNGPLRFAGFVIGRASLTGEAKVLAVAPKFLSEVTSCKVLTIGGTGKWRETGCPPTSLSGSHKCVALVKGILYFMGRREGIAAYDLETETWRSDLLQFPLPGKGANRFAEMSDSLVAVYNRNDGHTWDVFMDLWFLTDSQKALWSKRYTVTMRDQGIPRTCYTFACVGNPLWKLDDGKIVFWMSCYEDIGVALSLRVYDPRTNTCTSTVEMPGYDFAGVYKGSLLAGHPWSRN